MQAVKASKTLSVAKAAAAAVAATKAAHVAALIAEQAVASWNALADESTTALQQALTVSEASVVASTRATEALSASLQHALSQPQQAAQQQHTKRPRSADAYEHARVTRRWQSGMPTKAQVAASQNAAAAAERLRPTNAQSTQLLDEVMQKSKSEICSLLAQKDKARLQCVNKMFNTSLNCPSVWPVLDLSVETLIGVKAGHKLRRKQEVPKAFDAVNALLAQSRCVCIAISISSDSLDGCFCYLYKWSYCITHWQ
jgi:hypothetical protein